LKNKRLDSSEKETDVKTIVEEQETQASGQATSHIESRRPEVVKVARIPAGTETAAPQAKADTYESCLDLAALYLGRG
jgi:hypothetical protein